jgi:hypothetical protein
MLSKIIKTTMIIYWNHFHLTSAITFLYHVIKVLKAIIASFGNLGISLTHENYLKFLGLYFLYGQRVWKLFVHQLFSVKDKKQGAQLWSSRPLVLRYLLITNCVALVWKGGGLVSKGRSSVNLINESRIQNIANPRTEERTQRTPLVTQDWTQIFNTELKLQQRIFHTIRSGHDSLIAYCAAPLTKQEPAVVSVAAFPIVPIEWRNGTHIWM